MDDLLNDPPRVTVVLGTRPEAIKLTPVILTLRSHALKPHVTVVSSGQHREMLHETLEVFGLTPDVDLALMTPGQEPIAFAARLLSVLPEVIHESRPTRMLVQGDTTTAMVAATVGLHLRIPVGHVEAGLRTGDMGAPFPEEFNRRVIALAAALHFAPTPRAATTLLREGIPAAQIRTTGNTVVDAAHLIGGRGSSTREQRVVCTIHRRESFGEPMVRCFRAIASLAAEFVEWDFIIPLHPNPQVQCLRDHLGYGKNVRIVAPLPYREMIHLLRSSALVLTDSGGIQEEAPAFGTPVLVLRDKTERPEGIEAGVARLVGTQQARIVSAVRELIGNQVAYSKMARAQNPYGDGRASERIVQCLMGSEDSAPVPEWLGA